MASFLGVVTLFLYSLDSVFLHFRPRLCAVKSSLLIVSTELLVSFYSVFIVSTQFVDGLIGITHVVNSV